MAKTGPKPHEPTPETKRLVWEFAAFGLPQSHMANRLGISEDSLKRHYDYELQNGCSDMVHTVANKLYSKAVDQDDLGAQIFILKTRGRWREKDDNEANKGLQSVIEMMADKLAAKE